MTKLSPIQVMFEKYHCKNNAERRNAIKEIVQEIVLLALSRSHFFTRAVFYGGTCLRIFYDLDRFSEDLDFSLTAKDNEFDLGLFLPHIRDELASYGFEISIEQKIKMKNDTAVQSAFIKGGTLIHLLKIASIQPPVPGVPDNELLKIKIEIDTDPPEGAEYESKYRLSPVPYSVRVYNKPSLFAGKLHALLCRSWKTRSKGRDFYDFLWYLKDNTPVNLSHLESRMRQSGHWDNTKQLGYKDVLQLLDERFSKLDYNQIREDVRPFIKDTRSLNLWNYDFFISVARDWGKSVSGSDNG